MVQTRYFWMQVKPTTKKEAPWELGASLQKCHPKWSPCSVLIKFWVGKG